MVIPLKEPNGTNSEFAFKNLQIGSLPYHALCIWLVFWSAAGELLVKRFVDTIPNVGF